MISIELCYASPEIQWLQALEVVPGTTLEAAIAQSGIYERFPELIGRPVGVFGHQVSKSTVLAPNDRIEFYRALLLDPKAARLQRVKK